MWPIREETNNNIQIIDHGYSSIATYSPSGKMIAYSVNDTLKLRGVQWKDSLIEIPNTVEGNEFLDEIAFTPKEDIILGVFSKSIFQENQSSGTTVKFWTTSSGELIRSFKTDYDYKCMAFNNDGTSYAVGTKSPRTASKSPEGIIQVSLESQDADCAIYIWDMATLDLSAKLSGHKRDVNSVLFTEDSKRIISCSDDADIVMWDITSGEIVRKLKGHSAGVRSILLMPDNTHLISCSIDKTIRVWNINTGECIRVINDHNQRVNSLILSDSGTLFASVSLDRTVKVWSTEDYRLLYSLSVEAHEVTFSNDDRYLFVSDRSGNIYVYDAKSGGSIDEYKDIGTDIEWHPFLNFLLCRGTECITQLEMESLQDLIDRAYERYHHRMTLDEYWKRH
jgi:WD40 repeat protein